MEPANSWTKEGQLGARVRGAGTPVWTRARAGAEAPLLQTLALLSRNGYIVHQTRL